MFPINAVSVNRDMKRSCQHQSNVNALHDRTSVTSSAQNTAHNTDTRTDACPRVDLHSDVAVKLTTPEAKIQSSGLQAAVECKDATAVLHMQSEFKRRRKVVLTGLPPISPDEVFDLWSVSLDIYIFFVA